MVDAKCTRIRLTPVLTNQLLTGSNPVLTTNYSSSHFFRTAGGSIFVLHQTITHMNKLLIVFRLFNRTYGPQGNPKTLSVFLRPDNTIGYSFYGGWQSSGTSFSISNLQMQESLPVGIRSFKKVEDLQKRIASCLASGVGSNDVKEFEILNDI